MTTARHVAIAVFAFVVELVVLSNLVANGAPFWAQAISGGFALFVGWVLTYTWKDWKRSE